MFDDGQAARVSELVFFVLTQMIEETTRRLALSATCVQTRLLGANRLHACTFRQRNTPYHERNNDSSVISNRAEESDVRSVTDTISFFSNVHAPFIPSPRKHHHIRIVDGALRLGMIIVACAIRAL
jgi:hypothetical protein